MVSLADLVKPAEKIVLADYGYHTEAFLYDKENFKKFKKTAKPIHECTAYICDDNLRRTHIGIFEDFDYVDADLSYFAASKEREIFHLPKDSFVVAFYGIKKNKEKITLKEHRGTFRQMQKLFYPYKYKNLVSVLFDVPYSSLEQLGTGRFGSLAIGPANLGVDFYVSKYLIGRIKTIPVKLKLSKSVFEDSTFNIGNDQV